MEEREVIFKTDDYKGVRVMTSFSATDLEVAADVAMDDCMDTDKVIEKMVSLGYCRIIAPSVEIVDLGPVF